MERMSPSRSFLVPGIPWTTCSLTDVHRVAGKPWYPLNAGIPPSARMASSAIRSRSAVVTPMATASPARRSARADTRPASRMISISAGDLRMIMRRSALKDVAHVHEDSVHGTVAVDRAQQPLGRVVGDQGRGVLVIDVQTVGDRRDGVVVALID